ncbi:peptidase M14 [Mesobaculum littorinae]|uniref:Peptidase M14 n=1 Tax=Mesobaculum littorinae TaxID=2486419 RepID=A0A438AMV2_9RHOB|nr:peptidase M14 [Mesobaculum littorinae]RVV99927.1 peptidase M14 [Mesobaculum littorinae]
MTDLLNLTLPRTLDTLPENAATAWTFDSVTDRRAAERRAQARGRALRVRSAYKTLLHDVVEDGLLEGATRAVIRYPVVAGADADRFRLECYPLHALVEGCEIRFEPQPEHPAEDAAYEIETDLGQHRVRVPVRWRDGADGRPVLAGCGLVAMRDGGEAPLYTDYERLFDEICGVIAALPLDPLTPDEPEGPFFDRLEIDATVPAEDMVLPVGCETVSLAEALHEEIYFASLEIFRARLGLDPGQRSVCLGQVVPRIRVGAAPSVTMRLAAAAPDRDSDRGGRPSLDAATHWLMPSEIAAHLAALGGTPYACRSRQGREVSGRMIEGTGPARLAISAGQHPNESSPMVGALRAARDLAAEGRVSFTVNPLENPDGYALFRELCAIHPNHMHHAARYTASGADLSHGAGRHESAIRDLARARLAAPVHVNLHGYPAHEWTRPLSGYIPDGFAQWTIPKGFFLILRYDPAEEALAAEVAQAAVQALADFPDLAAQNRRMLNLYDRYVASRAFEVEAGCIPITRRAEGDPGYPVSLITEAADETIYGEDFRIAQEGQYRVVRAVAALLERRADA